MIGKNRNKKAKNKPVLSQILIKQNLWLDKRNTSAFNIIIFKQRYTLNPTMVFVCNSKMPIVKFRYKKKIKRHYDYQ